MVFWGFNFLRYFLINFNLIIIKGMMFHCTGPEIANITTKVECLRDFRNKWVNHRYNFDNLGQALMSLFVLSSKDGWVSIMYQGIFVLILHGDNFILPKLFMVVTVDRNI